MAMMLGGGSVVVAGSNAVAGTAVDNRRMCCANVVGDCKLDRSKRPAETADEGGRCNGVDGGVICL